MVLEVGAQLVARQVCSLPREQLDRDARQAERAQRFVAARRLQRHVGTLRAPVAHRHVAAELAIGELLVGGLIPSNRAVQVHGQRRFRHRVRNAQRIGYDGPGALDGSERRFGNRRVDAMAMQHVVLAGLWRVGLRRLPQLAPPGGWPHPTAP